MAQRRPLLLLLLLALFLCSHIALCSSAGGRKALLASADEDGEEAPVKKAKPAAGDASKIKKKVAPADGKNQTTKAAKPKTSEPAKKKVPGGDVGKSAKTGAAAKAAVKPTKFDAAAKAKKPSNSTAAAKPGKKPSESTADAKPSKKPSDSSKKPSESSKKPSDSSKKPSEKAKEVSSVEEDVVFAEEAEGTEDLMSEFRGLPARLQETLMPDLLRSGLSRSASAAASVALLLLPLLMLTALVRRMGPYLPLLHRALLLSQAYLAIYFGTLALAAAATGLEPLRFFHAASPAAYAWTQAAQSLGFMAYLVLQMVDLVAVFSGAAPPEEENGDAAKALGLAQMVVGLAVGLHYYAAVFHRAANGEAPRANWRVYAVYAACFVVICACARAERRKKAYLAGAEEWKKS